MHLGVMCVVWVCRVSLNREERVEGRGWRSRLRSVATERIVDPAPAAPAVRESDAPIHILLVSIGLGPFAADYLFTSPSPSSHLGTVRIV